MREIFITLRPFDKKAIGFIWLLTILVFGKAIQGDYLMAWDDNQQVVENEDVKSLSIKSLGKYFTSYYVSSYQPIASLSFAIEYAIFGKNAKVHHITNLLLHLINIGLVYWLLFALFKDKWLTVIVTSIFAVHPFQAEVLGWISTRSTLLYSTFILLAATLFTRNIKSKEGRVDSKTYGIVLLLYALAALTKSAAIVFPFTIMLLYYYTTRKRSFKSLVGLVPFFVVSIVTGLVSISSRGSGGGTFDSFYSFYSFKEHLAIRGKTLYFYLVEPFYQTKLHIYRAFATNPNVETGDLLPDYFMWQGLIGLLVFLFLVYLGVKNRKTVLGSGLLFGLAWFLINIGLHFNFFSVSVMVAERYLYLPVIGLGIVAYSLVHLIQTKFSKQLYILVFVPLIAFFSYISYQQIGHWKNETKLYTNDIRYTNYHYSYLQLGRIYHKKKRYQQSLNTYNDFIKQNPNEPKIYLYRALLINDMGDVAYATKDLYRILDIRNKDASNAGDPKIYGQAFYHLGLVWKETDKTKALLYLDSAIQLGNSDAVMLQKQLLMAPTMPEPSPVEEMSTYDYKKQLSKEDKMEEGSVYEIVPRCIKNKKYDKALYYLEMMEMVAPDSVVTYMHKAEALIGLKQYKQAQKVLRDAELKKLSNKRLKELNKTIEQEL